jgi:hypothetical protein
VSVFASFLCCGNLKTKRVLTSKLEWVFCVFLTTVARGFLLGSNWLWHNQGRADVDWV